MGASQAELVVRGSPEEISWPGRAERAKEVLEQSEHACSGEGAF
jgi:hypothetical protein